jgi:hypothetical protein
MSEVGMDLEREYLGSDEFGDMFLVGGQGGALIVVPPVPEGASEELATAISVRREASLNGRCQCAVGTPIAEAIKEAREHPRTVGQSITVHRYDCPAGDDKLIPLMYYEGLMTKEGVRDYFRRQGRKPPSLKKPRRQDGET